MTTGARRVTTTASVLFALAFLFFVLGVELLFGLAFLKAKQANLFTPAPYHEPVRP